MSSMTIASFLSYASPTISLVAQFSRWLILFPLLLPYFEAILLLILTSPLLNEPTISLVVSAIWTAGLDRNLRNVTYGNEGRVIQYDLSKAVQIAETTREIVGSFRRGDALLSQPNPD